MVYASGIDFAIYIPIGRHAREQSRLVDLLESISANERPTVCLLLVDDAPEARRLSYLREKFPDLKIALLERTPNSIQVSGYENHGGLCVKNLVAFDFLVRNTSAQFAIKLDTDSLQLRNASRDIQDYFDFNPSCGIIGTLGTSCNPKNNSWGAKEDLLRIVQYARDIARTGDATPLHHHLTAEQLEAFAAVSKRFVHLVPRDFRGDHCQGGAYAVSRKLMKKLRRMGVFSTPLIWKDVPLGEDRLMGILCSIARFSLCDCSHDGGIFGVQAQGLAYPAGELLTRGYALIHSLKRNEEAEELELRLFFRRARESSCKILSPSFKAGGETQESN